MSDDSPSTGAAWLPEGRLVDGLGALRVEIDAGVPGEPIKGHVDASSGGRTEFSGWIEGTRDLFDWSPGDRDLKQLIGDPPAHVASRT